MTPGARSRSPSKRFAGPLLGVLLAAGGVDAGTPQWLEVKSAHFTVITNAGDEPGRRAAWQFEQIRAALAQLWPWAAIESGPPFLVFAVKDEATLKTLGPQYWEGKHYHPVSFGASGRDKQFVALRTDIRQPDDVGSNPYQRAYWSYVTAVFNRSFPRRPPVWYSRGVAEVMSNTIVRDKELHVGRPVRENVKLLREMAGIPLDEFLAADSKSHWRTRETDVALYDAQAWGLVHYLLFGEGGAHSKKVTRFNTLLHQGVGADAALKESLGDLAPYYKEMRLYVQREIFTFARIGISLDTRPESYATRALSAGEAAVLSGEFLVAMNRPAEARAFAAAGAKADPSLPGPWEVEAELADREGRAELAKPAYQKAAEAGSRRAYVYYRLAQLEWIPNPDKDRLERLAAMLEKARTLDSEQPYTLSFLADVRLDLEQTEDALALARRAVAIDPAGSYHRLSLARVLWRSGKEAEAVDMARAALEAADTDTERRQAQEFLDRAKR